MIKTMLAGAATAVILAGTAVTANAYSSYNSGYHSNYGGHYKHNYSTSYKCKRVLAGYKSFKVWHNGHGGYGYGGYGGGYKIVKRPYYKRVCHYG